MKPNNKIVSNMYISLIIIISLLVGSISPTLVVAAEKKHEQDNLRSVLETDLSIYEGERFPFKPVDSGYEPPYEMFQTENEQESDSPVSKQEIWTEQSYETNRFIIKYKKNSTFSAIEKSLKRSRIINSISEYETSSRDKYISTAVLTTDEAVTIEELNSHLDSSVLMEINYIQPDYEMIFYSINENNEQLASNNNFVINKGEKPVETPIKLPVLQQNDVIVALIDTGVDTEHPDLSGKLVAGYDFVNNIENVNSTEWYYDQGHGTGLAGVISSGGAKVMPLKVFQGGKAYTSDILSAISFAEENGATIANMSFGSRFYNRALEEAVASSNMLFVCASGNILANIDKYKVYPASFDLPNVLTVSSVTHEDKHARFSNYGLLGVDIAAPGVNILVPGLNGSSVATQGTSVSAAIVSSASARTSAVHNMLNAESLRTRMIESADQITGLDDKIANGKRLNEDYAISSNTSPNTTIIDIPDTDPIPDIMLDDVFDEEYEEFGADGLITFRTPMPTAREGLGVVAIDKKIYAMGGRFNNIYYNKLEIYDTENDTWTVGANMTYSVSNFAYCVVGTNIYCFGGFDGNYRNYIQIYNTVNKTWSTKTSALPNLMGAAAVEYNGSIFITGGYNGAFINTVYQYNITANTFTARGNIGSSRAYHNAFVYNGEIYIEGGANTGIVSDSYMDTEVIYNPTNYSYRPNGTSRVFGMNSSVIIKDNRLIIIGGNTYLYSNYVRHITHRSMLELNHSYQRKNIMSVARGSMGTAMVEGIVYIIGGRNDVNIFNTVEAMEAGYKELKPMPKQLKDFSAAELLGDIYIAGGYNMPQNTLSREMYAYSIHNNTWQKKADLPAGTGSIISSAYGKLYLFSINTSNVPRVYEYNPQTNMWADVASSIGSFNFAQTINGLIYLAPINSKIMYCYSPLLKSWSQFNLHSNTGSITSINTLAGKLFVFDNKGYVFNYDLSTNSVTQAFLEYSPAFTALVYKDFYLFWPQSQGETRIISKFSPDIGTSTIQYSYLHGYNYLYQICVINNKIYVFTGSSAQSGASSLFEYMPSISPWAIKKAPVFMNAYMANASIGNKVYLAGGYGAINVNASFRSMNELYEYDIQNNIWTQRASIPLTQANATRLWTAGAEANGKFYVFGGYNNESKIVTNRVDVYTPGTDSWASAAPMPYIAHSVAAASCNNKIYIFGGKNGGNSADNRVHEYNPVNNTWTGKAIMPSTRYGASAAALNGKIYVFGGFSNSGAALNTLEVFDPVANIWETKAQMPEAKGYCGVAADIGIYAIGGADSYSSVNTVYQYIPAVDKWFCMPGLDNNIEGVAAVALNNGIYVINGTSRSGSQTSTMVTSIYTSANYYTPTASISDYAELTHLGSDIINPSGNLSRRYVDLSYNAPGFSVEVGRTYNSINTRDSIISKGWTFSFSSKLESLGNDTLIHMPDGSIRSYKIESNGSYTAKDSRTKLIKSGSDHILTTQDHYTYHYNSDGYLYRMTDPNGNQINLTVYYNGQITQVTDTSRTLTIAYIDNRISKITESGTNRVVSYIYDSYGRLSQVTDPEGGNTYYKYDSNATDACLSQVLNHNNTIIEQFTYKTQQGSLHKKVETVKLPTGNTETYTYDVFEGKVTIKTGNRTTVKLFDKSLYPVKIIDAEGGTQSYQYNLQDGINRYGEVSSSTDRDGFTTHYAYDIRGNIIKVINPDTSTRNYEYNANNDLITEIDERGNKTYYTYDANHNLLMRIKPLDGKLAYSSGANQSLYFIEKYIYYTTAEAKTLFGCGIGGLLKTYTDAAGFVVTNTYDSQGNLASKKDSLNRTTTLSYNKLGWLKKESTPMGFTTTYYYDKCGRLIKKQLHNGTSERYVYDKIGNMTQIISPNQLSTISDNSTYSMENIVVTNPLLSTTVGYVYNYSAAGKMISVKDPLTNLTQYEYDIYGNVTKETLPNGLVYTFIYDSLNRMTAKNYLDNTSTVIIEKYDYPMQVNSTVRRPYTRYFSASEFAVTTSVYDYANRLLKTEHPDGGVEVNTYLPNGLLATSSDSIGIITYYEYNPMNQIIKCWSPHDASLFSLKEWQYDNAGRLTQERSYVTPLVRNSNPTGDATINTYSYNIDSKINVITHNNVGKTNFYYNNDGLVSSKTKLLSGTRFRRTDYTYNYLGKVLKETVFQEQKALYAKPDNTVLYGLTTSYYYDANGNNTSVYYANGGILQYEYDALNRKILEKRSALNENNATVNVQKSTTYNNIGKVATEANEKGYVTSFTYNNRGFLTRITMPNNAITVYEYDRQGRAIREYSPRALLGDEPGSVITPPLGINNWPNPVAYTSVNYTAYTYDKMDRLLTKTEYYRPTSTSSVRAIVEENNTYNARGNLLTTANALNYTTTFTYGNAGRITTVKNALNQETKYIYDGLGRPTQQIDARNITTTNTYDLFGNLIKQNINGLDKLLATYDLLGNKLAESDANGNTTIYTYTLANQIQTLTNPAGFSIRYWYDEVDNVIYSLDSMGKEKITSYDMWRNLIYELTWASNNTQTISRSTRYDVTNNPVYKVDERGFTTTYTYDKLNRVISVKNPLNQVSTKTYDANGNIMSETDWRGNTTTYSYDILNRMISVKDPNNIIIETLTYTDAHEQATSTDALNYTTTYTYDKLSRLLSTKDAENYINSRSYDAVGNIITKTDGNGKITKYSYNNYGYLINVTDANNIVTSFTRDNVGNVLSQTDGKGNTIRYTYNELNQVLLKGDPGGISQTGLVLDETRVEKYAYYPNGQMKSRRDKNKITTIYTYDIYGRKIIENTGGSLNTTYSYDASGNLLSVSDSNGSIVRTYDALGRVLTKTASNVSTLTFTYDITNGLNTGFVGESTTIDGRVTTRVFDKAGRIAQVKDGSLITSYEYYNNGSLKKQTLPIGVTSEYTYYKNNRLDTLQNKKGTQMLESYKYTYDGAGNITAKQDVKGTTIYTYSSLSQLLKVSEPSGRITQYVYDNAGNRTKETVTIGSQSIQINYTISNQNRLVLTERQAGTEKFTNNFYYDDAGNMISRIPEKSVSTTSGTTQSVFMDKLGNMNSSAEETKAAIYEYNVRNQLVGARSDKEIFNVYNAEGYRAKKTVNSVTTNYNYEYDKVIKESYTSGGVAYNTYGINLISRETGGQKVYYMYNGHGDVTQLLSASGAVLVSYYYDAFGNITEQSGNFNNPYRYSGYIFDEEAKLYNLNARFYDPIIARFMQEDTSFGNRRDPLSLNLYTYCVNNPLIYYDPTGHDQVRLTTPAGFTVYIEENDAARYLRNGKNDSAAVITSGATANNLNYQGDVVNLGNVGIANINNNTLYNVGTVGTVNVDSGTVNNYNQIGTVNASGNNATINNYSTGNINTINAGNNTSVSNVTVNNSGSIGTINNTGTNNNLNINNSNSIGTINNNGTNNNLNVNNSSSINTINSSGISNNITVNNSGGINYINSGNSNLVVINTGSIGYVSVYNDNDSVMYASIFEGNSMGQASILSVSSSVNTVQSQMNKALYNIPVGVKSTTNVIPKNLLSFSSNSPFIENSESSIGQKIAAGFQLEAILYKQYPQSLLKYVGPFTGIIIDLRFNTSYDNIVRNRTNIVAAESEFRVPKEVIASIILKETFTQFLSDEDSVFLNKVIPGRTVEKATVGLGAISREGAREIWPWIENIPDFNVSTPDFLYDDIKLLYNLSFNENFNIRSIAVCIQYNGYFDAGIRNFDAKTWSNTEWRETLLGYNSRKGYDYADKVMEYFGPMKILLN